MSRKRRGPHGRHRGGRVTPKGTRPRNWDGPVEPPPPLPDPLAEVRSALTEPHPLAFLAQVSTYLHVSDPRTADPFTRDQDPDDGPIDRNLLFESLADLDDPAATALVLGAAELLVDDEVLAARLRRAVAGRSWPQPAWLRGLGEVEVHRCVRMSHVLGDGDNYTLGLRWAGGWECSLLAYVDHNMGTLVKDAFPTDDSVDQLVQHYRELVDHPEEQTWTEVDLAEARAVLTAAIERHALTYPPVESETWPVTRPLIEWAVAHLPAGGEVPARPEWSPEQRDDLQARFLRSPWAAAVDDEDELLVDTLVWFGCDYGPGDPLRWSPVSVEIVLMDFLPRKILGADEVLHRAPAVLRAFVRFCHAEREIPAHLTDQTVAAIDEWTEDYLDLIGTDRPRGPAAILASLGYDLSDPDHERTPAPTDYGAILTEMDEAAVGGPEALAELDTEPLPDEPFDWTDIPADVHDRVDEIRGIVDEACDHLLDVEYRTACRRLLARLARTDPALFRRKARTDIAAAAVVVIIGKANELFHHSSRHGMTQTQLFEHMGVGSSASQRATTMLTALGVAGAGAYDVALGDAGLLVSERRAKIVRRRDHPDDWWRIDLDEL